MKRSEISGIMTIDIHSNKSPITLDTETQKIDAMVKTVKQAIATLQEYRAALITAAVTGKIDVRSC